MDHIAGFAVVAGGFETGGDNYAVAIFVENESVQRAPPRIASTRSQTMVPTMRAPSAMTPRAETKDWIRFMDYSLNGLDEVTGKTRSMTKCPSSPSPASATGIDGSSPKTVTRSGWGSKSTSTKRERMKRMAASMSGTRTEGTERLAMLSEIAERSVWSVEGFIGLKGAGNRLTDDMVRQSTTEVNEIFWGIARLALWCKVKGMMGKELTETKAKGKEAKGKKIGRPLKILSADVTKKAIEAARLGIPLERIAVGCGFWNNGQGWQNYLARNPAFAAELEQARFQGELELSSVVRTCGPGWQGSAWLLERTRGYVARASLEHTGKGGKDLSISGALLGAFGNTK